MHGFRPEPFSGHSPAHPGASGAAASLEERRKQVQRLYLRHSRRIRAFIRALTPPQIDPEELFQDTFLVVVAKAEQYRPEASFLSWVFGVARLELLTRIRDYRRSGQAALREDVAELLIQELPANDEQDDAMLEQKVQALRTCMEGLSPASYRLIRLFYFDGLAGKTIAQRLGIAPRTVYNVLNRARTALRQCIERQLARLG